MITATHSQQALPAPLTFQLGDVRVSVSTALPDARTDLAYLYGANRPDSAATTSLHLAAVPERRSRLGRRRYGILADNEPMFTRLSAAEVVPYLEWGVNWRFVKTSRNLIHLHAATLVRNGQAVVFLGDSGAGKSTLAAGLMSRGWEYYGDELALIDPDTLHARPFPKALCIKAGSFDRVRALGLPLYRRRHYVKAYKGPVAYVPAITPRTTAPRPIAAVILTHYAGTADPRLTPTTRAHAAFELVRCQLNHASFNGLAASRLCALARQARCLELRSGNLHQTLLRIEDELSNL